MGDIELNLDSADIDKFTISRDSIYLHGLLSDLLHAFVS